MIADLESSDPLVRVRAVPALGDLGETAAKAIPALQLLTDYDSQHPLINVLAAGAIARIDPGQAGAVIPVLIDALGSDDAPLQDAAADELGMIGKHAEPALPALLGLLGDDCAAVRSTAAEAIWRITGDRTPARRAGNALQRTGWIGRWDWRYWFPWERDLPEVGQAACDERGPMSDGDSGDLRVHRADADSLSSETLEFGRRRLIEVEDADVSIVHDHASQSRVGLDLSSDGMSPCQIGEPTSHLLLEADDGHAHLGARESTQSLREALGLRTLPVFQ